MTLSFGLTPVMSQTPPTAPSTTSEGSLDDTVAIEIVGDSSTKAETEPVGEENLKLKAEPEETREEPLTALTNVSLTVDALMRKIALGGTERLRPDVRNGLIRVTVLTLQGTRVDLPVREAISIKLNNLISAQPNMMTPDSSQMVTTMRAFGQQGIGLTIERAITVGRMLGARFVMIGEIDQPRRGAATSIKIQIVSIKRKGVINTFDEKLSAGELERFQRTHLERETRLGATWRSAIAPGWGQVYQGRAGVGALYAATAFGALIGGILSYQSGLEDAEKYRENKASQVSYRSKGNLSFERANFFWGALGTLWVTSVVDAYLSGKDRVKPTFSIHPQGGLSLSGAF